VLVKVSRKPWPCLASTLAMRTTQITSWMQWQLVFFIIAIVTGQVLASGRRFPVSEPCCAFPPGLAAVRPWTAPQLQPHKDLVQSVDSAFFG
jgi:hypothetical protein